MRKLSTLLVLAVVAMSCQKDNLSDESQQLVRKSTNACDVVSPQSIADGGAISRPGGNADCNGADYEFSSARVNRDFNETSGTFEWSEPFPDGFTISYDESSKQLSWSYQPVMIDGVLMCLDGIQVITKGGPNAQTYTYASGVHCGEELEAPRHSRNNSLLDISNVTICYNLVPCTIDNNDPCYEGETAWSDGDRYQNPGNWATYTTYPIGGGTVNLYAGQTHLAGTVTFSAVVNGEVTIDIALNSGFVLQSGDETVKIQGYDNAPSGNPAPGGFDTYKGNALTIVVDAYNYYGIHLDVNREVPCD
ncbi:MAG: hypothetical protein LAT54_05645 [Cryomorphaceae bacterium]|nr:hypothetical protein [Cryomorphaceae bacterium]